jgi:hypothetical protein
MSGGECKDLSISESGIAPRLISSSSNKSGGGSRWLGTELGVLEVGVVMTWLSLVPEVKYEPSVDEG